LNLDNGLGGRELAGETVVLVTQTGQLDLMHRRGWSPAAPRRERAQGPRRALPTPIYQVRRIQSLATQQGTQLTGRATCVGLFENLEFVGGSELTPARSLDDFGVRWWRQSTSGSFTLSIAIVT